MFVLFKSSRQQETKHKAKQEKDNGKSHRQTNIQFNVGKLETPEYTAETNQGKQDKGSKTEYRAQNKENIRIKQEGT